MSNILMFGKDGYSFSSLEDVSDDCDYGIPEEAAKKICHFIIMPNI